MTIRDDHIDDSFTEHLIPLDTVDPAADFEDLEPLRNRLADATVIGLGEATHGTREFFRFKHRLLRYLITELDLRIVAFEASFAESLAIDEYVVHGRGDPETALEELHVWPWKVEAVRALIEWLRAYNATRPMADRVRFYGIDAQYTHGSVHALRTYLERVDPAFRETIEEDLVAVDDEGRASSQDDHLAQRIDAGHRVGQKLDERLDAYRDQYIATSSREAWERARQQRRVLEQAIANMEASQARKRGDPDETTATERCLRTRDRAMANNVEWLLEHNSEDRIAVWAHDAHVNRSGQQARSSAATAPSLGSRLADRYGQAYYAVGFAFGSGSFQAIAPRTDGDGSTLRAVSLDGPLPETFETSLAAAGHALAYVDLRSARAAEHAGSWLTDPQPHFSTGAVYEPDTPAEFLTEYEFGTAFDGICYVDETTRARPLETGN